MGRDRLGQCCAFGGAGLGLAFAFGFAALILLEESSPPFSDPGALSLPLLWSVPGLLAVLSIRDRRILLVPAAIMSFLLAFTPFVVAALVLLIPAVGYVAAFDLRRGASSVPRHPLLATTLPILASAGAFITVLIGTQPICYHYREDLNGDRMYTEVACGEGGRLEPALVTDTDETAAMGSAGSSRLRPAAAASGAVLVVVGLGGGWVLAAPRGAQAERRRPAAPPRRPTARRESKKSTST